MKQLKYFNLGSKKEKKKKEKKSQKKPKENKAVLPFSFFFKCDIVPLIPKSIAGVAMVIYFSF